MAINIDLTHRREGRPSLLTPEVADTLYRYISEGNYLSTACAAAGISYDTYSHWQMRGKRYHQWLSGQPNIDIDNIDNIDNLPDHDGDLIYYQLLVRLKQAEALAEAHHVSNLMRASDAGPQYWAASATYLERKHPDRWGRRDAPDASVQAGMELLTRLAQILRPAETPPTPPALPPGHD